MGQLCKGPGMKEKEMISLTQSHQSSQNKKSGVFKFPKNDVRIKQYSPELIIKEYFPENNKLPLDSAIAEINTSYGPKINKVFTELFFVLQGQLEIESDGHTEIFNEGDVAVVSPDIPHTIRGYNATVFIVCTPPFQAKHVEMLTTQKE